MIREPLRLGTDLPFADILPTLFSICGFEKFPVRFATKHLLEFIGGLLKPRPVLAKYHTPDPDCSSSSDR